MRSHRRSGQDRPGRAGSCLSPPRPHRRSRQWSEDQAAPLCRGQAFEGRSSQIRPDREIADGHERAQNRRQTPKAPPERAAIRVWRWRPLIRLLYCPSRAINAATRAGGQRFTVKGPAASHIDAFAGPEGNTMAAGSPANGDPPVDDKNRRLVFDGIDRPLRTAHRRNRLRRDNPEFISSRFLGLRATTPDCSSSTNPHGRCHRDHAG